MKKVVLINFGSLGDIHPFIGLGLALQKAGIKVVFGTNLSHVPRVQQAGLEAYGVGPDLRPDDPELIAVVMNSIKGPEILHKKYIFPSSEKGIADSLPLTKDANLILTGMLGYFVPTLSELTKVPWGMAMLAPMAYWSAYDPPELPAIPFLRPLKFLGPTFFKYFYQAIFSVSTSWAEPLQAIRKKNGLPPQPNPMKASTMTSGSINLALFSKHFAAPQPDWPKNLIQPGYMSYDGPGNDAVLNPDLGAFLSQGDSPVLMTLGSTNVHTPGELYEIFHEALLPLQQRAIMLVGSKNLSEYKKKFESKTVAVFDYAPYAKLMPHCSTIVHQGGAGTTGQCLRAGKPSIIVGSANDQLDNARHVEEIGAGVKLPLKKLSVSTLREALIHTQSAAMKRAASDVGEHIRSENAEATAVLAIQKLIG